jgi:hypothetical protein
MHASPRGAAISLIGCHSWRTDGPIVAEMFPQFATKLAASD